MRRMEQKTAAPWEEGAELGVVTIGGNPAAVETRGEVRNLPVFGPGGYIWQPRRGQQVLILKGGPGGEEQCLAAAEQAAAGDLLPGATALRVGKASLVLRIDGKIELRGLIYMNGELVSVPEEED